MRQRAAMPAMRALRETMRWTAGCERAARSRARRLLTAAMAKGSILPVAVEEALEVVVAVDAMNPPGERVGRLVEEGATTMGAVLDATREVARNIAGAGAAAVVEAAVAAASAREEGEAETTPIGLRGTWVRKTRGTG